MMMAERVSERDVVDLFPAYLAEPSPPNCWSKTEACPNFEEEEEQG
jgi:hypothetical protein